jgi:hypothetical protein
VSAETLAAFRDAMRRINESSGAKLDDDGALLLLARAALSAGAGDGEADSLARANYQVVVFECDHWQPDIARGARRLVPAPPSAQQRYATGGGTQKRASAQLGGWTDGLRPSGRARWPSLEAMSSVLP